MRINRYINGEKTEKMPKEIQNEAVREVLAKAENRVRKTTHA